MKRVILLTHSKELDRKTGTGPIVKRVLGDLCEIILWKRREPYETILKDLDSSVLLYPGGDSVELIRDESVSTIVILDGTWQEARKIYNKSSYIKDLRKVSINSKTNSIYNLRRNQKESGLCTAEAASVICSILNEDDLSRDIISELELFLKG